MVITCSEQKVCRTFSSCELRHAFWYKWKSMLGDVLYQSWTWSTFSHLEVCSDTTGGRQRCENIISTRQHHQTGQEGRCGDQIFAAKLMKGAFQRNYAQNVCPVQIVGFGIRSAAM
jgi:hypothetical protein